MNKWGSARTSTAQWKRVRLEVLDRDDWVCQIRFDDRCLGEANEVDHIKAASLGGSDDPANLRAVCSPCHQQLTSRQATAAKAAKRARLKRAGRLHPGTGETY